MHPAKKMFLYWFKLPVVLFILFPLVPFAPFWFDSKTRIGRFVDKIATWHMKGFD